MLFLTLPAAIWDSNVKRRPFWGGFFVVGIANILLFFTPLVFGVPSWNAPAVQPGAFQLTSSPVGTPAFVGGPQFGTPMLVGGPQFVSTPGQVAPPSNKFQNVAIIRASVIFISPVLGGLVIYFISLRRERKSIAKNAG